MAHYKQFKCGYKYNEKNPEIAFNILKQGKGIAAVCAELNINQDTYFEWRKTHPEFRDASTQGRIHGVAWWDEKARVNVDNKNYNEKLHTRQTSRQYVEFYSETRRIELPELAKAKTYAKKGDAIIMAVATAKLTPDEALKISQTVMNGATLHEKTELEARLIEIEKSVKGK